MNGKTRKCTCIEKCVNCRYGSIDYKDSRERQVKKVYCRKWNSFIDTKGYKGMKFCLHFERR